MVILLLNCLALDEMVHSVTHKRLMQPSDCIGWEKPSARTRGAPQTHGPGAGVKHSGTASASYMEATNSSPHTSNLGLAC